MVIYIFEVHSNKKLFIKQKLFIEKYLILHESNRLETFINYLSSKYLKNLLYINKKKLKIMEPFI